MGNGSNSLFIDLRNFSLQRHIIYNLIGKTSKDVKKHIVEGKLKFPKRKITEECKSLLVGLLTKDPEKRLKINDVLLAPWFSIPYSII